MRRILFVDDDFLLRKTMRFLIEVEFGLSCTSVASLAEVQGLEPELGEFSVALLDINLGAGPDGVAVFKWLRSRGFSGKVAFITGHAKSDPIVKAACSETGVEVLEKPVSVELLRQVLTG